MIITIVQLSTVTYYSLTVVLIYSFTFHLKYIFFYDNFNILRIYDTATNIVLNAEQRRNIGLMIFDLCFSSFFLDYFTNCYHCLLLITNSL